MHSAFFYSRAMWVQSGQSCPWHVCSPRGVSLSLSLCCLLLFNVRTELWTAQKFQTHYCTVLCRELFVRHSVFAFLLPPRTEREMRHLPFCVFLQWDWVSWWPHQEIYKAVSRLSLWKALSLVPLTFSVAVVENTADLILCMGKIA